MSEKKEKSRLDGVRENWNGFKKFLYNSEEKTVLGRGSISWLKILIFYVFYYGFLACLFAISISLVLNSLDENIPRYQTRLQTPGVAIQPKIPSKEAQTSEIVYSLDPDDKRHRLYVEILDKFLKGYDAENQTDTELFKNCPVDKGPSEIKEYGDDAKPEPVCRFVRTKLGPCGTSPYGYDEGRPCVIVKVNRIINWLPVGYTDLSRAVGNDDSDAPPLRQLLSEYSKAYRPYLMYTFCYGAKEEDEMKLNGGNRLNTKYFPTENGFPFGYYPYLGKKRQPQYLNPLVAVQFTNVTRNVDINVRCKVYALNIRDYKEMGEGYFGFKLNVKK